MRLALAMIIGAAFVTPALAQTQIYNPDPVVATDNYEREIGQPDPQLAANKKLVSEFVRRVLIGRHLEEATKYLAPDFKEHFLQAPAPGLKGFFDYWRPLTGDPRPVPDRHPNLIHLIAERNVVIAAFVMKMKDAKGELYPAVLFDMFELKDGKITAHWDSSRRPASTSAVSFDAKEKPATKP